MTDDIERARRILADPCGLMLPGSLGKALLARIDALEAQLAKRDTDETTTCALDRALDRLGYALDKARNGE